MRVAGLGALAAVLVEALLEWRSALAIDPTGDLRPRAIRLGVAMDGAVAAWAAAGLLSAAFAAAPRLALQGEIGQREGVLTTLALAGLYAGARRSHRDTRHARVTLAIVIACAALAAAYAMLQFAGLDPLSWAHTPTYSAGGGAVVRAFSTLGNPILLGNLLAAALALCIAWLACGRGDALWLVPAAALIACATAATLSRGAWLGALAGGAAALAGALVVVTPRPTQRIRLALVAVAAPVAVWGAIALRAPVAARLAEGTTGALSGAARLEIARSALALWVAHPWLGAGPDSFGLMFPNVQTAAFWRGEWLGVPVHAHSVPLQALATLGTVGALAGIAWLVALGEALARPAAGADAVASASAVAGADAVANRIALGAAAIALATGGAINPVGLAGAACWAVFSALAVSGGAPASAPRPAPATRWRPTGRVALAAGLAVAVALAVGAVREVRALAAANRARAALERATSAAPDERLALGAFAAREAEQAARHAAGEDELWRLACDAALAQAEAALAHGQIAAAESAATDAAAADVRALQLMPLRASNYERVGNVRVMRARIALAEGARPAAAELGDTADEAFGEARRLAPADGLVLIEQARGQLLLQKPERALATARRITALYPDAAAGHAFEAAALLELGRYAEARAALHRARAGRWEQGSDRERSVVDDMLRQLERPRTTR